VGVVASFTCIFWGDGSKMNLKAEYAIVITFHVFSYVCIAAAGIGVPFFPYSYSYFMAQLSSDSS
jgi:hypothetical protein